MGNAHHQQYARLLRGGRRYGTILPYGTQVRIIGRTGDSVWLHIETLDGTRYWVSMFDMYGIEVEPLHDHATPTVIPTPIVQVQVETRYLTREVPVYIQQPAPPPEVIIEERIVEVEVQAAAPPPPPVPLHLQPIPNDTPENYRRWQEQRDGNIASTP